MQAGLGCEKIENIPTDAELLPELWLGFLKAQGINEL